MYRHIEVKPRACGFGAAVTGVDLAGGLNAAQLADVRTAWYAHSVLAFPGQPLTHEQLENFTQSIGPYGFDPYLVALKEHPHILEVRRDADEKAQNFGASWHSDWSFQDTPPSATILHSKVVPPVGGDTLFIDCTRALEALSPVMRDLLGRLQTIHSAALAYSPRGVLAQEPNKRSMGIIFTEEAEKTRLHPMLRTHAQTGRKSLFVNPVYTVGIEGMTQEESFILLAWLYEHQQKEEFVYRHRWEPDMLLMWDNRCVNHMAEGGYDGYQRIMHRTTVAGEQPTA
jgi:taurine dioxygenase